MAWTLGTFELLVLVPLLTMLLLLFYLSYAALDSPLFRASSVTIMSMGLKIMFHLTETQCLPSQ
jgi:hypothetical protein